MNVFAAAVVLSSVTLDDFLDKAPDERLDAFGELVGRHHVVSLNSVLWFIPLSLTLSFR